jgi:hypothetical protein
MIADHTHGAATHVLNINQMVLVKPTEVGFKAMQELHSRYCKAKGIEADFPYVRDRNGFIMIQLWKLMREFGDHIFVDGSSYFETDMKIFARDLDVFHKKTG